VAVKIRLVRTGAKGRPSYRIVVVDSRVSRAGKNIEILGTYNPLVEPSAVKVDGEKVLSWIKKGAQPTLIVKKLLGKAGVLPAIDFSTYKKKKTKQKEGQQEAAPAAPAAPEAEKK
jgi:small subunit ribosomal protein S16